MEEPGADKNINGKYGGGGSFEVYGRNCVEGVREQAGEWSRSGSVKRRGGGKKVCVSDCLSVCTRAARVECHVI